MRPAKSGSPTMLPLISRRATTSRPICFPISLSSKPSPPKPLNRFLWRTDWLSKVLAERNFCSIGSQPIELVPLPCFMTTETHCGTQRRFQRISLPNGMSVAWYGGGDQQVSRVKTLGMGGVFLSGSGVRPVGTSLTLVFQVPGGIVQAEGIVRSVSPDEGMGVEFTKMN